MKFDQTYIAIRKRNVLEILDLAFHVIRDHFAPLFVLWFVGLAPFAIANWLVIRWMAADYFEFDMLLLYFFTMTILVASQAQIATTLITSYLGQAIFSQRPSIMSTIASTFRVNPWFIWVHGFLRMVVPTFLLVCLMSDDSETTAALCFFLICAAAFGLLVRCLRPFASEILILEKTPIRATEQNKVNYKLRSSSLHKAASSELTSRFILMAVMSVPLAVAFVGTLVLIDSWLNLHASQTSVPMLIYFPLSLWTVAGVMAVVRFLSYIDIRIRQEGWEVELRLRAEAIRLERALG